MRVAINVMLSFAFSSASAFASLFPVAINFPRSIGQSEECRHTPTKFSCVDFLYNYDGDTIKVRVPNVHPLIGERISVRVVGVDTPELVSDDQCERAVARVSRNFVGNMLSRASRIDLVDLRRDKYFRILADVVADGESVSQALLARALAVPYNGGAKMRVDWCERAEQ